MSGRDLGPDINSIDVSVLFNVIARCQGGKHWIQSGVIIYVLFIFESH